jgi:hypothetical protein
MTDNGAAMLADETVTGLASLGIVHQTTLPYSPYQYVALKVMWRRIRRLAWLRSVRVIYAT